MKERRITVGIVGCANIARRYAIKAFQTLDTVGDIFIASRDPHKSQAFADEFSINTKDSYDSLIDDPNIDAVYIPLPVGLHEDWVIRAAASRKHVLCEKSLSNSLGSAQRMIDACQENGVTLFENFMCDYHPQHEAVLSLIQQRAIGEPFAFKGYFGFSSLHGDDIRYDKNLGGGSLNDAGAYTVFMARKMLAAEPTSVVCYLDYDSRSGVDTRGAALLEFPENKIAFLGFSFDNFYQNEYSIWGRDGTLSVDRAYSIPPEMKPSVRMCTGGSVNNGQQQVDVPAANHFELIFRDFCDTILLDDHVKRHRTYEQLLNQARVLEAMRLSSQSGQTVRTRKVRP